MTADVTDVIADAIADVTDVAPAGTLNCCNTSRINHKRGLTALCRIVCPEILVQVKLSEISTVVQKYAGFESSVHFPLNREIFHPAWSRFSV